MPSRKYSGAEFFALAAGTYQFLAGAVVRRYRDGRPLPDYIVVDEGEVSRLGETDDDMLTGLAAVLQSQLPRDLAEAVLDAVGPGASDFDRLRTHPRFALADTFARAPGNVAAIDTVSASLFDHGRLTREMIGALIRDADRS
jgi:hypothetical protein